MMPLTLIDDGRSVNIKRIGGSSCIKSHLEDLGFTLGGEVSVVSSFGGNLIVCVKGVRIALGKDMASRILVD